VPIDFQKTPYFSGARVPPLTEPGKISGASTKPTLSEIPKKKLDIAVILFFNESKLV
jgi:hypothetical protein